MKNISFVLLFIFFVTLFSGCGETIGGVKDDAHRMWRGTKMIFVSED